MSVATGRRHLPHRCKQRMFCTCALQVHFTEKASVHAQNSRARTTRGVKVTCLQTSILEGTCGSRGMSGCGTFRVLEIGALLLGLPRIVGNSHYLFEIRFTFKLH